MLASFPPLFEFSLFLFFLFVFAFFAYIFVFLILFQLTFLEVFRTYYGVQF